MLTLGTYFSPVGAFSELIWLVSAAAKIIRDHCREYDPTTGWADPTTVCPNMPIIWLVTAESSIVIGEGWLNTRAGNDYLLTSGTHFGSISAFVQLRWRVSATAKVMCDGPSAVFHCRLRDSVKTLSRSHQRRKSVYTELLDFRYFDRVTTGAQSDIGRSKPLLNVEPLGHEHSIDGIIGEINVFNLGNGATVYSLQTIGVSYGEQIHPLGSGGLVVVIHP